MLNLTDFYVPPRAYQATLMKCTGTEYALCNPETYDALLSPHLTRLNKWVRSRAPKSLDPDDIVQQTLVLALRNIAGFRLEASVGTWLCTIALNVIRGRLRSWEHSRIVSCDSHLADSSTLRDPDPSPLDALEKKERSRILRSIISKLPESYRLVVELLDLNEFSTEEIMDTLSISRSALKSRHFRARRMLFDLLIHEQDPAFYAMSRKQGDK